jgi:hypothetical protein
MRRTFDLLTEPLADNERRVVSCNISWKEPTAFRIIVAPSVINWFQISVGIFFGSRLSFEVKRTGQAQTGVRFSALVECITSDRASQRPDLTSCYWPPPDALLFQSVPSTSRHIKGDTIENAEDVGVIRPALPLFINPKFPISIDGLRVFLNDRGWPLGAIADGTVADDDDRRGLYIPFEFPVPLSMPKKKAGVEWIHFAGARHDLRRAGSDLLEGEASFGTDPPDFVLKRSVEPSIELAQFTLEERRRALALARGFRNAVQALDPERISHLRGHLVMFGFDTQAGLPPRPSDAEAIAHAIARLENIAASATPNPIGDDLRDGFVIKLVNSTLGRGDVDIYPLSSIPLTQLGRKHGFEIATSYTTLTRVLDTEQLLTKLVNDHDVPGNDVLLLSAGAPGISGLCLLGDEIAVEPSLLEYMQLPAPSHLKRVILHRWAFGDVYELFPRLRCIAASLVSLAEGGVIAIPARDFISDVWVAHCPCGSRRAFAKCHGQL